MSRSWQNFSEVTNTLTKISTSRGGARAALRALTRVAPDRKDVVRAYRTYLGRAPESEETIQAHLRAPTVYVLHRRIMESREFIQRRYALRTGRTPMDLPSNEVEVQVTDDALNTLLEHIRRCWEFMGQERPHHSVMTDAQFLPENLKNNEREFWKSGQRDASTLIAILERHGMKSLGTLSCIDFGCGVGRVTAPLAERFSTVNAYDISVPHMEIARSRANTATFHLLRELPVKFLPTDVFYSRIVLQHNPPPIIALLIRSALNALKAGGIAVFQVPTYEIGYRFIADEYLEKLKRMPLNMEMHCLPQHHIFKIAREAGCEVLEVREEDSTGRAGFDISNLFVIRRPSLT